MHDEQLHLFLPPDPMSGAGLRYISHRLSYASRFGVVYWTESPEDVASREENARLARARRAAQVPRQQARAEVTRAIQDGRLIRPKVCSQCGGRGRKRRNGAAAIEAHHDDYRHPFQVRWLCRNCHRSQAPALPLTP